jgi:hypothetical protein
MMNVFTVHYRPDMCCYEVIKNATEVIDAFDDETDAHSYAIYLNDKENAWLYPQ